MRPTSRQRDGAAAVSHRTLHNHVNGDAAVAEAVRGAQKLRLVVVVFLAVGVRRRG